MSAIIILKKEPPKKQIFSIFLKGHYFVLGGSLDVILVCFERILGDFQKVKFCNFPQNIAKFMLI